MTSPIYILEEQLLRKNLALIQHIQKETQTTFILALKGFAMWSVFPIIKEYITGVTASSLNEALLGNEFFQGHIHTYSPAYLPNEFAEIVALSSHITFNSLTQYAQYQYVIKNNPSKNFGLRINPQQQEATIELYDPSTKGSRLGITSADLTTLPEVITGLHIHNLCENNFDALLRTWQKVEEDFGPLLYQIEWMNLGGGHLITQKNYNIDALITLLNHIRDKYNVKIIMEPGSAYAWETGYLQSTILDIIENNNIKTAILDVSFTCHMPDCLEMPYLPKVRNSIALNYDFPTYRLGGISCLSGDFVGDYSFKNSLKIGDTIIFEDMIHYTMVKNNMFNGVNLPSIAIKRLNGTIEILKQFNYLDYRNRLS